jgi:phage baseplate assembly protein W
MRGLDATTGRALSGIEHLRQSIADILQTRRGTRVMRRNYGSDLHALIDAPLNRQTVVKLIAATAEALAIWEPRIALSRVIVQASEAGRVDLEIQGTYLPDGKPVSLSDVTIQSGVYVTVGSLQSTGIQGPPGPQGPAGPAGASTTSGDTAWFQS